jgi:hypothetical protein
VEGLAEGEQLLDGQAGREQALKGDVRLGACGGLKTLENVSSAEARSAAPCKATRACDSRTWKSTFSPFSAFHCSTCLVIQGMSTSDRPAFVTR